LVVPSKEGQRNPNNDLSKHSKWVRNHLTERELRLSELPHVIRTEKKVIKKPISWYPNPELFKEAVGLAIAKRGNPKKAFELLRLNVSELDGKSLIELMETEEGAHCAIEHLKRIQ
jgi:6-hydroxy-3-succinoylpyridine 3-monooxygenase